MAQGTLTRRTRGGRTGVLGAMAALVVCFGATPHALKASDGVLPSFITSQTRVMRVSFRASVRGMRLGAL